MRNESHLGGHEAAPAVAQVDELLEVPIRRRDQGQLIETSEGQWSQVDQRKIMLKWIKDINLRWLLSESTSLQVLEIQLRRLMYELNQRGCRKALVEHSRWSGIMFKSCWIRIDQVDKPAVMQKLLLNRRISNNKPKDQHQGLTVQILNGHLKAQKGNRETRRQPMNRYPEEMSNQHMLLSQSPNNFEKPKSWIPIPSTNVNPPRIHHKSIRKISKLKAQDPIQIAKKASCQWRTSPPSKVPSASRTSQQ